MYGAKSLKENMDWASPDKFIWFWAALTAALLFLITEWRKKAKLKSFADSSTLPNMANTLSRFKRTIKQLLILAGCIFLVIGLAAPQGEGERVKVNNQGLDIVIAIDVSDSMLARDIKPSRLDKAKLELSDLVDITRGDKLGVVAFAGDAFIQVPLTLDRDAVKLFLKSVSPGMIPVPGTAIARAIDVCTLMFDEGNTSGKVIVLLTDGEDLENDPVQAAKKAAQKGIQIYPIGIGTDKGDIIPIDMGRQGVKYKRDDKGNVVVSKLDEKMLQRIAVATNGRYYRAQRGLLEVDKIYKDISDLDRRQTGEGWVVEKNPLYQWPIILALLCLLIPFSISETRKEY
ncbi:MAG: Ca-activated chloride channel family protein [Candidatus Omnitrophota bacterium]